MTTTKTTPGPWKIKDGESSRVYLVNGPDGAVGEIVYADCRNPADAALIAAAPDLKSALKRMLNAFYEDPMGADTGDAIDEAYVALEKAEGYVG